MTDDLIDRAESGARCRRWRRCATKSHQRCSQMADLREELRRRTVWFYETQLRRLNYNRFRGERWVKPGSAALQLISEPLSTLLIGARPVEFNRVYLDSQQPVWTDDDDARHGKFQYLVGRMR